MKKILILFALLGTLSSCEPEFQKNPMDDIIRDMKADVFTIVLNDMDVTGTFFHDYFHQYKIIQQVDSIPVESVTEWMQVSKTTFTTNQDNMGMELAHKGEDGKLVKEVAPPGYSNYVGNPRYGHWETRNGSSFWAFYGQYMFMSSMFNMMTYPVRRSYYDTYRGSYYGTGRPYYGPMSGGSYYYGTNSAYNKSARPNSTWSRNNTAFKSRVSGRTSRSSSRIGGSSSRSSSGGFGK